VYKHAIIPLQMLQTFMYLLQVLML
jgi:hypothetical protein